MLNQEIKIMNLQKKKKKRKTYGKYMILSSIKFDYFKKITMCSYAKYIPLHFIFSIMYNEKE